MSRIFDAAGRGVPLGPKLGTGGEGSVFEIQGAPERVAKIYHEPVSPSKAAKLTAMSAGDFGLTPIVAWPVETLHTGVGGPVQGFTMPRVRDHVEVHYLYGPAHRKQTFPSADWTFLIHAARNLAAAFAKIHEAGHVIGDVNQGNVAVSTQGTIRLIDCDSFQIRANGTVFPCEVGVGHFTPPELQGRSFAGVVRSENHDAFGLAVLIFHLLFMGRHPFAGRFLGTGHMPIEKAITEFRFAFGADAGTRQMQPPPDTLPLAGASGTIASLFGRAFSPQGAQSGGRPGGREWMAGLDQLKAELAKCARVPAHRYHRSLQSCPWCGIQATGGPDFFLSAARVGRGPTGFNLDAAWAEIERARRPHGHVPLPSHPVVARPTVPPMAQGARVQRGVTVAAGWGAAALGVLAVVGAHPVAALLALVLAIVWFALPVASGYSAEVQRRKQAYQRAVDEQRRLHQRWQQQVGDAIVQFEKARAELDRLRAEYLDLEHARRRAIAGLDSKREESQCKKHLEIFFIDRSNIPGIGPGRRATLASYGIETAADVTPAAVSRIPGFGPKLTNAILAWRRDKEALFRFNPTIPVDPADIAATNTKFDQRRQEIERALSGGPHALLGIVTQSERLRQVLAAEIRRSTEAVAVAKANLES